MLLSRICGLVLISAMFSAIPVTAAPKSTPIPGGAKQVKGLAGKIGDNLFNGVIRLTVTEVRDATPEDHPEALYPSEAQKAMVLSSIVRNGLHGRLIGLLSYTLADKDDVTVEIRSINLKPPTLDVQQAAAAKQHAVFLVDKTFTPVKVLVQCSGCSANFKAFRISIP